MGMRVTPMRRLLFVCGVLSLLPVGCGYAASPTAPGAVGSAAPPSSTGSITVFAAASLKAALAKVKSAYEGATPGTTLTISTDSSAALETQIEQGAPADLFLSADVANPRKLFEKGLAAAPPVTFAGNQLTVIVPAANPEEIRTAADLANPGVKVIAAGDAVPITRYATQLVANLAREPGYPGDFVARYTANVVSKEDNVAAVVAKIELGEGDAGIVYVTDAGSSTRVATIPVPSSANVPASYAGVVVKGAKSAAAASALLAWLPGPDGQAVLATFGFLPPG
jgi:molybdate transport system substrate-binding protein